MITNQSFKIELIYGCYADEYNTTYKWIRITEQEFYFPLGYQWFISEEIGLDT